MIVRNNFTGVLTTLGYELSDGAYQKYFPAVDCKIVVDPVLKKIFYPNGFERGFDHNENFVVLECVTRLLDKGYRPKDIELEKTWRLGHGASGGRSDICINGLNGKTLAIIECKTAGAEFDAALDDTKRDGGQLFSYWQQTRECKWLVLYTADFVDGAITHRAESIDCSEPEYKRAYTAEDLFKVWSTTYEHKFCGDVIFSPDSVAYRINVLPLLKKNLVDFESNNRIINRFEEILRHNNVSDKENAFNRLTALFISKLADESSKSDGAEVEFQYKIGTDDIESLQDRLQRLYSEGMRNFMREEIFYVSNNYVEKTLSGYIGQRRANLIDELNRTMRRLKFYTNNEFAFKEIHNEKLFLQNGKILIEVVQLFERYRIIGAKNLQLLGDLFEQLLNKGFKQNEGQFFTPIPISRFIWDSLPLTSMLRAEDGVIKYPRIIDYACGAGHFLTQGFEAINDCVRAKFNVEPDPAWVATKLYGIEKDYRLSRVSKISLFMHGAGLGNIVFGEGLDDHTGFDFGKEILPGRFDILTANPPYAVAAFKQHLGETTRNNFSIIDKISNDGSEIETLFIERAAQLLKPLGIAAIILPSSILNKDNASFIAAREILIKRFMIRAIVRLGSKTFGATGTNTAIFFLQKFDEPLRRDLSVEDSVDAIFNWREALFAEWEDKNILDGWLEKISVDRRDYKNFILRAEHFDHWAAHNYFDRYHSAFVGSSTYTKKIAQPSFKRLSEAEQIEELDRLFYGFAHPLEREKLWCFGCTYNRTTLIVTAPDDNKGQETFLGYKWSNRKGAEGMQTIKAGGLLYDPNDRLSEDRIAALVRAAFDGRELEIDGLKDYYYYLPTHQMLDFKGVDFNRGLTIARATYTPPTYIGEYPLVRLSDVAAFVTDRIAADEIDVADYITTDNMLKNKGGVVAYEGAPLTVSAVRYEPDDILISNIRPYLKKIWLTDKSGGCSNDVLVIRAVVGRKILPRYLFVVLENDLFFEYAMATARGIKMPRGDKDKIMEYGVPLPPIDVQRSIVSEFDGIVEQLRAEERIIRECDEKIADAFNKLLRNVENSLPLKKLFDSIETGSRPTGGVHRFAEGVYSLGGEHVGIDGRLNLNKIKFVPPNFYADMKTGRIAKNDILMCKDGALSGKVALVRDELNNIHSMANEHVFVLKNEDIDRQQYIFYYLSSEEGQRQLRASVTGMTQGGINRTNLERIIIPVPPIERQREFAALARSLDAQKTAALNRQRDLISERERIINRYFC